MISGESNMPSTSSMRWLSIFLFALVGGIVISNWPTSLHQWLGVIMISILGAVVFLFSRRKHD
jgi:hypothetical protein